MASPFKPRRRGTEAPRISRRCTTASFALSNYCIEEGRVQHKPPSASGVHRRRDGGCNPIYI
jgi:hypothetical protein